MGMEVTIAECPLRTLQCSGLDLVLAINTKQTCIANHFQFDIQCLKAEDTCPLQQCLAVQGLIPVQVNLCTKFLELRCNMDRQWSVARVNSITQLRAELDISAFVKTVIQWRHTVRKCTVIVGKPTWSTVNCRH